MFILDSERSAIKIANSLTILVLVGFMGCSVAWGGQIALDSSNVVGGSATYSGTW